MAKKQTRTIEIPQGVDVTIDGPIVKVRGKGGELKKELNYPKVSIKRENNTIVVSTSGGDNREYRSIVGTYEAHIKNMIIGVTEGYTATMKAVYAHFPVSIKQVGNTVEVSNFLGEKAPRIAKIFGDVKIKIQKEEVTIEGANKEAVGQTAVNIEKATKVSKKDIRVFQDGVYITKKP